MQKTVEELTNEILSAIEERTGEAFHGYRSEAWSAIVTALRANEPVAPNNEESKALRDALTAIRDGYAWDWLQERDLSGKDYSTNELNFARWDNCREVARAVLERKQ